MTVSPDYDLKHLNTFRLPCCAKFFVELNQLADVVDSASYLKTQQVKYLILGGGSNVILPQGYLGLVIHNKLLGIELISHHDDYVIVEAMAGENWDYFVAHCLTQGWYGLENLSLIPGTVGASPIQNIGAYGVEVKQFIDYVKVYDLLEERFITLTNTQCQFGYRNSIFKRQPQLLVLAVGFKLLRRPKLNLGYKDIVQALDGIANPSPAMLRDVVVAIRKAKLPDPAIVGNVGSFFHNPIVSTKTAEQLKFRYDKLPIYPLDANSVKISAGWLIDNLGLKGHVKGNIAVYAKQALVLINTGNATQAELLDFAAMIQQKITDNYGVSLNIEPLIID
jgi:UDP-N-acetylmuramate dehydrogenase